MSFAQRERHALVDSMRAAGPDSPTLCGEWTTRDLAAHLIVRERRPDASPGIVLAPLAPYLERVQGKTARQPWEKLLDDVDSGPPIWSPLWAVDAVLNLTEMFVHHEDVRRGSPGWEPRVLAAADQAALWSQLKRTARMAYRKSPVGVVFATPAGERAVVHKGEREVVLTGEPAELLLHTFGRSQVRIEWSGDPADIEQVQSLDHSV